MLATRLAFQVRRAGTPALFQNVTRVVANRYASGTPPRRQTKFKLNSGAEVPALGFGTFQDPDAQEQAVGRALELGFRHIDTAQVYDTEIPLGNAIKNSGVPREEIFLSTKLWMTQHHPDDVEKSLDRSLANMQTDYLDILLMHFPSPFRRGDELFPVEESTGLMALGDTPYLETWKAMEKIVKQGKKLKAIGMCNFTIPQMEDILKNGSVPPAIHQNEFHPWLQQPGFLQWHKDRGIHITSYSPLGNSNPYYQLQVWSRKEAFDLPPPTEDPILIEIGKKYGKSPHQVAYAWGINQGRSVLSKSVIDWQIVSNLEADFELDQEDMEKIATMDKKARFNDPSPLFNYQYYEGLDGYKDMKEWPKKFPVSDVYGKIGLSDTK